MIEGKYKQFITDRINAFILAAPASLDRWNAEILTKYLYSQRPIQNRLYPGQQGFDDLKVLVGEYIKANQ
jgi:hypothetical protein